MLCCYRLKLLQLTCICWSPSPHYLRRCLFEISPLRSDCIKMSLLGWVLIKANWCPHKQRRFGHTQGKGHVRAQQEDGLLQAKKRGLQKNRPCSHAGLGLPAENKVCWLSPEPVVLCYGSLGRLIGLPLRTDFSQGSWDLYKIKVQTLLMIREWEKEETDHQEWLEDKEPCLLHRIPTQVQRNWMRISPVPILSQNNVDVCVFIF